MAKRRSPRVKTQAPAAEIPGDGIETIDDGQFSVRISGGPLDGKLVAIDLLQAELACEAVESKHKSYEQGWIATPPFLADMAIAFQEIGVQGCTPTVAYRLWHITREKYVAIKKNTPPTPN